MPNTSTDRGHDQLPEAVRTRQRAAMKGEVMPGISARVGIAVAVALVLGAVPQGGRDPADRVNWHRWGEPPEVAEVPAPWPGATPGPSPALVAPGDQRIEVEWDGEQPTRVRLRSRWEPVLNWAGPWRRTGRWWTEEGNADRYQLVTSAGAMLCERRNGAMYLTGVYD